MQQYIAILTAVLFGAIAATDLSGPPFVQHISTITDDNIDRILWDEHKEIGCSVVKCSNFTNVVCHYAPKLFTTGGQIYKMGEPCKRCSGNAVCEEGLCVL
ncbi:hypothetical protein NECAME_11400 [Necator americanus]|uniref:SCP domain-containing protein n=1 Tax=Necator americanus TaxID=51031 RepID=W2T4M1_NECAM|nr:hypothetical protein NECAME_11400 [Necator americanus]ETN76818.1 hypothetical protein NECAME_11400 [Necator americanus]